MYVKQMDNKTLFSMINQKPRHTHQLFGVYRFHIIHHMTTLLNQNIYICNKQKYFYSLFSKTNGIDTFQQKNFEKGIYITSF